MKTRQLLLKSYQVAGLMPAHVDKKSPEEPDRQLIDLRVSGLLRARISEIAPFEEISRYQQMLKDPVLRGRVLFES